MYDSFATSSGTSTPVKETPSSSTTDDGAAAAAAASGSTGEGGEKTEAAVSSSSSSSQSTRSGPTLEQELEQMSTFVSGMGKNLGSYWGQFRRQVSVGVEVGVIGTRRSHLLTTTTCTRGAFTPFAWIGNHHPRSTASRIRLVHPRSHTTPRSHTHTHTHLPPPT